MEKFFLLGSSKGIGYGIALELVKRQKKVYLGSRNIENLKKAADFLNEINKDSTYYYELDLHSFESIEKWFNNGLSIFKELDGLLINYGGPPAGNFIDIHDKTWKECFEYMLLNPIRLLKLIYPYIKNKKSSILIITSYSVKEPIENLVLSNVFRSGITSLVKTLSREWGPNVRINCIMPGRIDTDRIRELDEKLAQKENKSIREIKEYFNNQIPLKRYGTIEEIGKVGAFLLCEDSSYITGSSIAVDGGLLKSI